MPPPSTGRLSDRPRSRSRSRSPSRNHRDHKYRDRDDTKDRGHHRRHHHHHHSSSSNHKHKRATPPPPLPSQPIILPLRAKSLVKHDLNEYRPLFASYLDIQKQLDIDELTEEEVKGRWKSFMGKWNRGELAEGWYDPTTKQKAIAAASEYREELPARPSQRQKEPDKESEDEHSDSNSSSVDEDDDDDDAYGPDLPHQNHNHHHPQTHRPRLSGPAPPTFDDLALRADQSTSDSQNQLTQLRDLRKQDRQTQRDRLDELAPRAEPGTKERQLEKKREGAFAAKTFRESAGAGGGEMEEVAEGELFGGGGGTDEVKRMRREMERKKNEREVRREEILRARAVEREERVRVHREREERTMGVLRAIARERFG